MRRVLMIIIIGLVFSCSLLAAGSEEKVRFRTGEMDLPSYIEMVADTLKLQINANPEIGAKSFGPVTVNSSEPMTKDQAMAQVYSTLAFQGLVLLYDQELDVYRLLRTRDGRDENLPLITDPKQLEDNDRLVTYVIHLKYFPAEALARTLRSFMPPNSRIVPFDASHLAFVTDSSRNIKKSLELVARVDNPKSAAEAEDYLKTYAKENRCSAATASSMGYHQVLFIVLFSLVALILGFLFRGYLIRRIEGGL